MPSIIAGSRARLNGFFKKDGVAFDPQIVIYESTFVPRTIGVNKITAAYTFGVGASIVRSSVGFYYVEVKIDTPGRIKFTWRSTAFGEEINVEEIVDVVARTVVVL